jgi:hypothetical protein
MDFNSIKIHALLDSEASACFIDKDFVNCYKLSMVTKKHPIPLEIIDGRPLVSRHVIHETAPIDIVKEGHYSIIAFNIIKSPSNPVVIGLSWLNKYNPAIDWKIQRLIFQPRIVSIQKSSYKETSSYHGHQQLKSFHGKISTTQITLVVGARAFM